jgi:hypothetical protein
MGSISFQSELELGQLIFWVTFAVNLVMALQLDSRFESSVILGQAFPSPDISASAVFRLDKASGKHRQPASAGVILAWHAASQSYQLHGGGHLRLNAPTLHGAGLSISAELVLGCRNPDSFTWAGEYFQEHARTTHGLQTSGAAWLLPDPLRRETTS